MSEPINMSANCDDKADGKSLVGMWFLLVEQHGFRGWPSHYSYTSYEEHFGEIVSSPSDGWFLVCDQRTGLKLRSAEQVSSWRLFATLKEAEEARDKLRSDRQAFEKSKDEPELLPSDLMDDEPAQSSAPKLARYAFTFLAGAIFGAVGLIAWLVFGGPQ